MKHGVLTATLGALMFALTAHAVTVDGHVFLSGQTDHEGTRIVFAAVSPSARTDSTLSASDGHFSLLLQPGVYDVGFSNNGYASFTLEDQLLLFDTALDTQQLMPPLSGNLSGTLGPGDFDVVDTIRVAAGDSLTIAPGTRLYFREDKALCVYGPFWAVGTEQDSVSFTRRLSGEYVYWSGIRIETSGSARFEYCVIERVGTGYGAVFSNAAHITVAYCTIRDNLRSGYAAGGLTCVQGALTLAHTVFQRNFGEYGLGAVYIASTSAEISDCFFDDNGKGISCSGQAVQIRRCTFSGNGTAISCADGVIENCFVRESNPYGAAVLCSGAAAIRNSTVVGGIRCSEDAVVSACVIAFADNYYRPGIEFSYADSARVGYCCIYDNAGGAFGGGGPVGLGIVALINANGDSCDTYYNIFLDPQFVDVAAGDYHLTAGSPCIDAGDPDLPYDPDGTVADMGAFYFDQLGVPDPERTAVRHYLLSQNYPNPFNARTRISFSLAQAGEVSLSVFDITGRLVRTLADGRMAAGTHEVSLDARDLPSGVYVYRLAAGEVIETKKMVIIK